MNKNVLIGIVLVVTIGLGAFIITRSDSDSANSDPDSAISRVSDQLSEPGDEVSQQAQSATVASADNPLGLDTSSIEGPYRLIATGFEVDEDSTAIIEVDADGNIRTTYTIGGQTLSTITYEGDTYNQDLDGTWTRFPGTGDEEFDISSEIAFSEDDLDELNDANIVDMGTGSCSTGTCRIYGITDLSGESGVVKIDANTNRLSEISTDSTADGGGPLTITYEYDSSITVTPPSEYTDFSLPELENLN